MTLKKKLWTKFYFVQIQSINRCIYILPLQIVWMNCFHSFSCPSIRLLSYSLIHDIDATYKIWPICHDIRCVYQLNWLQYQQPYTQHSFASFQTCHDSTREKMLVKSKSKKYILGKIKYISKLNLRMLKSKTEIHFGQNTL